jgi:predicted alpha/beta superfamily hydrolase
MADPTLFDAYAAIDPSLWWDREALSRKAAVQVGSAQKAKPVYLAIAKEQAGTPAPMQRVARAVQEAGSPMCLAWRQDLLHSTIYQQLTPQALQFLLPPAEQPHPESGFDVQCSQRNHHRRDGK